MIKLEGTTQEFFAVKQLSPFDCDKAKYVVMYINQYKHGFHRIEYVVHYYDSRDSSFHTGYYTTEYADAMKNFNSRGWCQH